MLYGIAAILFGVAAIILAVGKVITWVLKTRTDIAIKNKESSVKNNIEMNLLSRLNSIRSENFVKSHQKRFIDGE